jgi:hypothetical protein
VAGVTGSGAWGFWVQAEATARIDAHARRATDPGDTENGSERSTIGARLPYPSRAAALKAPILSLFRDVSEAEPVPPGAPGHLARSGGSAVLDALSF